ncbi:MAG: fasciclin domain-containing protein [Actinomycetota bacterium]
MKKILVGIAAAAKAVVGTGAGASADSTESLFDSLRDAWGTGGGGDEEEMLDFLLLANIDDNHDTCTGPLLTVFFPESLEDAGGATVLAALTSAKAQGIIGLHVTSGVYTTDTLETGFFTELPNGTTDPITITQDGSDLYAEGFEITDSEDFCRGVIHYIDGIISTDAPAGDPSCGAALVPQCAPAPAAGSGSGLPKTGSESMALTYAALASLIAGAGVLVIRRRSIA